MAPVNEQQQGNISEQMVIGLRNVSAALHSVPTTSIIHTKSSGSGRAFSTLAMKYDVVAAKASGGRRRDAFLAKAGLEPPPVLRMIDCTATCEGGQVVLVDWEDSTVKLASKGAYSAISHTYGGAVYEVFNCSCASICRAAKARACCTAPCPHEPTASDAANTTHYGVVKDILNMCAILRAAGVDYAWHDGVCIAQHDDDEVRATIEHIGWIYSSAKDTIVFLHYIGTPMAPVRPGFRLENMVSRWDTRVWTIQEAAVSKCRRYCVRVSNVEMLDWDCRSPEDVVRMVGLWYDEKFSKVEVVNEERFFEILKSLGIIINSVLATSATHGHPINSEMFHMLLCWGQGVENLLNTLINVCFSFPDMISALSLCGRRDSKHRGDRINSILTLAGVKGFVAPKDTDVEASTLEFFKRQGKVGLVRALFTTNVQSFDIPFRRYEWLPVLDSRFVSLYAGFCNVKGLRLTVLENKRLEVRPGEGHDLLCIRVRIVHKPPLELVSESTVEAEDQQIDCWPHLSLFRTSVTDGKLELGIRLCKQEMLSVFVTLADDSSHCRLGTLTTNLLVPEWSGYRSEQVRFARIVSPSSIEGEERPLQVGEFFDAYLGIVRPSSIEGEERSLEVEESFDEDVGNPMLLLHNHDIQCGEVSRIGLFKARDSFVRILSHPLISFVLHKLEKVIIN